MIQKHGIFTISLDFEMYWGVRDKRKIDQYNDNLEGVWKVVPLILDMFSKYEIHATWATVGFLFFKNNTDLKDNLPRLLPTYCDHKLSPYKYIESHENLESIYHFTPNLINSILKCKGQEIATHTFSHYYCLEEGQTIEQFNEDITKAVEVARKKDISIKSIIFPRNQCCAEYLTVLNNVGIECYRGNESGWMYRASTQQENSILQRAFRLLDVYINISGHNTYSINKCAKRKPYNFPSSRFLRPYENKLAFAERLRLKRIKSSMKDAAVNKKTFHLWWHPHNFGNNITQNMDFLNEIMKYYQILHEKYGMQSLNMDELCQFTEGKNVKKKN